MQELTNNDYKLFRSLAGLSQKSLRKTMADFLRKKYDNVIVTKDFVIAEGTIPIALVAHLDTVFDKQPGDIFYDKEQGIMWSPVGLGADDRAGVFSIIKIIQSGLKPTVIFTTDEEKGCLGADALISVFKEAPMNLNYIIQLDRRGSNDCVFYDCDNKEFVKYVESFGFLEAIGSFSDISVICPSWGIAGVNLSVGYEHEHSVIETLHVPSMLRTISIVKTMLKCNDIPEFEYIPSRYSWWGMYKKYDVSGVYPGYDDEYWFDEDKLTCSCCGKSFDSLSVIPARGIQKDEVYFCPDCCVDHVKWCTNCGEAYEVDPKVKEDEDLCPKCKESLTV